MEDIDDQAPDLGAELDAMKQVGSALAGLDENTRKRVLQWAGDRFGISVAQAAPTPRPSADNEQDEEIDETAAGELPDSFAEFFALLGPKTDPDRALAAAYWFKEVEGRGEFTGYDVNSELTQLGHKVSNITKALGSLIERKPQLILQKGKSGKSKQARKTYAISHAGAKEIEQRMSGAE